MSWFPPGWFPGGSGGGPSVIASVPSVTCTALVSRIKLRLSRRTGTAYDVSIKDELTNAQQNILEDGPLLPQFLLNTEATDVTGAHSNLSLLGLSRLFLRPETLYYQDTTIATGFDGVKIRRYDDLEQLNQLFPGEGEVPKGYFWDGNELGLLELRPYVTGDLRYYFKYFARDPFTANAPDPNDETFWTRFAGDYLMHSAGLEIAQFLRDQAALSYFSQKRQEAYTRFVKKRTAVENSDQELVIGD